MTGHGLLGTLGKKQAPLLCKKNNHHVRVPSSVPLQQQPRPQAPCPAALGPRPHEAQPWQGGGRPQQTRESPAFEKRQVEMTSTLTATDVSLASGCSATDFETCPADTPQGRVVLSTLIQPREPSEGRERRMPSQIVDQRRPTSAWGDFEKRCNVQGKYRD